MFQFSLFMLVALFAPHLLSAQSWEVPKVSPYTLKELAQLREAGDFQIGYTLTDLTGKPVSLTRCFINSSTVQKEEYRRDGSSRKKSETLATTNDASKIREVLWYLDDHYRFAPVDAVEFTQDTATVKSFTVLPKVANGVSSLVIRSWSNNRNGKKKETALPDALATWVQSYIDKTCSEVVFP